MELSIRQKSILELLLGQAGERSLAWIAEGLGVSARTVHRDLARLAPQLSAQGLVLSGRAGLGVKILGSPEAIQACSDEIAKSSVREPLPEERRCELAVSLLVADDPLKLFALSSDAGAATAAIRNDLDILEPWFGIHGITLSLKRGLGVRVEGSEEGRREALCSLVMEQYGEAGILSRLHGSVYREYHGGNAAAASLAGFICDEDFRLAETGVAGLLKGVLPPLAPCDYLALVSRLAVSAKRRQSGHDLGLTDGEIRFPAVTVSGETRERLLAAARIVSSSVSKAFGLPDSDAEAEAVYRFLLGAKPERNGSEILGTDIGSLEEVKRLIEECGKAAGRDFASDRTLRDGLAAHWGPALYRLRNRLPIRNPILGQIRSGYPELFAWVSRAVASVFPGLDVPADEIGYLVMHFGSSLGRHAKEAGKFRVLVVCSAGIGSAHMLASRIRAELPEIEIVASLSWFDVKDIALDDSDLLVSTIPLPLDAGAYALVDPLLGADGVRAIREAMKAMTRRRNDGSGNGKAANRNSSRESPGIGELKRMRNQLEAVIGILERFRVFEDVDPGTDWESLLEAAIARCALSGLVRDSGSVLEDLRERSRDRGIMLPGTRILFLHARSHGAEYASLTIHVLAVPPSEAGATWTLPPTHIALMLAPRALEAETQDILNEISVSFLDAKTAGVLGSGDERDIRAHYTRYLDRYFRSFQNQGER